MLYVFLITWNLSIIISSKIDDKIENRYKLNEGSNLFPSVIDGSTIITPFYLYKMELNNDYCPILIKKWKDGSYSVLAINMWNLN